MGLLRDGERGGEGGEMRVILRHGHGEAPHSDNKTRFYWRHGVDIRLEERSHRPQITVTVQYSSLAAAEPFHYSSTYPLHPCRRTILPSLRPLPAQNEKTKKSLRIQLLSAEIAAAAASAEYLSQKRAWGEDRLGIARLLSLVSPAGHSLVSWAAACGQTDIVEVLIDHGATVGPGDDTRAVSASIVQACFCFGNGGGAGVESFVRVYQSEG